MVDQVMPAGVPAFLQIMQVRNVGADGGGNSVSGSKAKLCVCVSRVDK